MSDTQMNDFHGLGVDEVRAIVDQQLAEHVTQGPRTAGPAPPDLPVPGYAVPAQATPSTTDKGSAGPWEALRSLQPLGLKEPPKYSGYREGDAAKVWLIQVERWLEAREVLSHRTLPDRERIALVTSYLEKQAAAWWNLTYQASKDDPTGYPPYDRWEAWKEAFSIQFGDVRTQEQRRDEFDSLRQLSTVQAFRQAIEARRLYLNPRPTDADCLLLFKRGLKAHIRNRIEIVPDTLLPDNYLDYVAFADKSEREYLASKNRVGFFANRTQPRTQHFPTYEASPANTSRAYGKPRVDHDGDVEMAFNNLRIARGPPGPRGRGARGRSSRGSYPSPRNFRSPPPSGPPVTRTPEEKDIARRDDLCFRCMKAGHRARDCTIGTNRGAPTRRGGRGKGSRR